MTVATREASAQSCPDIRGAWEFNKACVGTDQNLQTQFVDLVRQGTIEQQNGCEQVQKIFIK
jgi:hypothetical protein